MIVVHVSSTIESIDSRAHDDSPANIDDKKKEEIDGFNDECDVVVEDVEFVEERSKKYSWVHGR